MLKEILLETFDDLRLLLNQPVIYFIPDQELVGLEYNSNLDCWVNTFDECIDKEPNELVVHQVPTLWGADVQDMVMEMGGIVPSGNLNAIIKAKNKEMIKNNLYVTTGTLLGDKYNIVSQENAPDGSSDIFIVIGLARKE